MNSFQPVKKFMALGDVTDIRTRGGSPYYILTEGRKAGFIESGADLKLDSISINRYFWNFFRLLTSLEKGGYQFTNGFSERLFLNSGLVSVPESILSQFPLFPPDSWIKDSLSLNFYIDATLRQNFAYLGARHAFGKKIQRYAVAREKERYQQADRIVCMARWAAESLTSDYGIPSSKIYIIPGGANLGDPAHKSFESHPNDTQTLKLGFIGKNWRHKNLPFLLEIAEHIHKAGQPIEVLAAGFAKEEGPDHHLLTNYGFIDKHKSLNFFSDFLLKSHFGCLFSQGEAFGLSNREFLKVGVPVLTWDIGGLPDTVPKGAGLIFSSNISSSQIANNILDIWNNWESYLHLREKAESSRSDVTWASTIRKFKDTWSGSKEYQYKSLSEMP